MSTTIFAYGVLMFDDVLHALTGRQFRTESATLPDFQRYTVIRDDVSRVPVIFPESGAEVEGVAVFDIDPVSMAILDDFEDCGMNLYQRIDTQARLVSGDSVDVGLYIGLEEARNQIGGVWSRTDYLSEQHDNMLAEVIPHFLANRPNK